MTKTIDIVVNLFGPEEIAAGQTGFDAAFMDQVRMPDALRAGVDADAYVRLMDEAGVEHSLLIAVRAGDPDWKGSFEIPMKRWRAGAIGIRPVFRGWRARIRPAGWGNCAIWNAR
jgi:hypothetical protein